MTRLVQVGIITGRLCRWSCGAVNFMAPLRLKIQVISEFFAFP